MYKVLIVDDEPIICEGLKKSVRWSDFNCEVVATAENGLEGLEIMKTLSPDILISDISMNNMDGLAMVAAIKSEHPGVEVCLLTGYRNFEYAQRAIKLGVTRFLLKPSRMDELEEAIRAMTDNLRRSGNMGGQIIDNLWDMQNEEDQYLYETFIKNRPESREDSGENDGSSEEKGRSSEARVRSSEANGYVVKKSLLYILHHYDKKLSLTDVANECYVSSWHLSKLLNHYTGRGFFEVVNLIRLNEARHLLTETGERITDISERVGFQDVAHFSRIFKTYTGCSPKEYRDAHRLRCEERSKLGR
jgi:YesN/AraC family two-component response regulator